MRDKEQKITGGSIALLLGLFVSGIITIIAICGISVAHERSNELLNCRQRLVNSSVGTEKDKERADELQRSVWVNTSKYVIAVIVAVVGLLTFASLSNTLPVLFWKAWRRISTRGSED